MLDMCYSFSSFAKWVIYAFVHAAMVLGLSLVLPCDTLLEDGRQFGFWAGGHHVYMNCILLANFVVLRMQNLFTGFGEVITFLQVASYFGMLYYF